MTTSPDFTRKIKAEEDRLHALVALVGYVAATRRFERNKEALLMALHAAIADLSRARCLSEEA
jgi:hypothetical protein